MYIVVQHLPFPNPSAPLAALTSGGSGSGVHRVRLVSKFKENQQEKVSEFEGTVAVSSERANDCG